MKRNYTAAIVGLAVVVLTAGVLMYFEWRSYEEKVKILYVMLEQQNEGKLSIDIVTELLKGQSMADFKESKQKLEQYGYGAGFISYYKKTLYHTWELTVVILLALYAGFAGLLLGEKRRNYRQRQEELFWLGRQISVLRNSAFEHFERINDAERENRPEKRTLYDIHDGELGHILTELVALSDSLSLFRAQTKMEREETKVLVTDISHQLKTPVAALKTSFEILQSDDLSAAEQREFLERCSIQIVRLEELVAALVNISRMETGMIALKKEEKNLFETLLLAVNRIYPKAEEKEIEIELEAEDALQQIKVFHDEKWLCEAFLNILENAVKYSDCQTKIVIRMIKMSVYLRIEFDDEGIGIPKKEWNRIFQRFYRGEAPKVQKTPGSGVGLYLAREITVRHGGTLAVSSSRHKGSGSCFIFQFPYLKE